MDHVTRSRDGNTRMSKIILKKKCHEVIYHFIIVKKKKKHSSQALNKTRFRTINGV